MCYQKDRGSEYVQSFLDELSTKIQLKCAREIIDEVGIENAGFVQVYIDENGNEVKTDGISILTLLRYNLRDNSKIFLVYPFEIELCWNRELVRLFACDCAEYVLPFFENVYTDDNRPRNAIEVSRLFALGKAYLGKLNNARVAAENAALNNARWRDGSSEGRNAAWSAAKVAVWNVSNSAAWNNSTIWSNNQINDISHKTESDWQIRKLLEYLLEEITLEDAKELYGTKTS